MTILVESRPKCALIWQSELISYAQLIERARARACHLREAGARVIVFGENCPEWIYCAYATWIARAVLVPVDHLSTAAELAHVIDDARPAVICCSEHNLPTVKRALETAHHRPTVLLFETLAHETPGPEATQNPEPITVDEAALAAIVYTSGTTGSPKGVMLSFGNLMANVRPVVNAGYFTAESRVLLLLPLHHVLPLAGSLAAPLFGGSTIVFATSMAGQELLKLLQQHRITAIVGVPRFYDLLHRALREKIEASPIARTLYAWAKRIRSRALSRLLFGSVHRKFGGALEYLICGGAALDSATAETFDVLGFRMCEGYGMTECAPMITFPRPDAIRLGSTGQVLDGCEVRIDEGGEILARGPNVMLGYYGRPDDTNAILRDGWLHTGDLGRLDEQGYLYVTGRLKEILVLPSGKKLDPVSVELGLQSSPAVREVGVFLDNGTLHALVVPHWETLPTTDLAAAEAWLMREIVEPYNATVSPYRRVLRMTLLNGELPRTRLGKLRRHLLVSIAQQVATATANSDQLDRNTNSTVARLATFLSRLTDRPVTAASRLQADLGLDSLGRVELTAFVERVFGVVVPETRLADIETVGLLARFVNQSARGDQECESVEISWAELLHPSAAPRLPRSSGYHRAIVYLSRWLVRSSFRLRAHGMERLPKGPFILVPNHQSYLDGLFVAAFLPPRVALDTMFYAKEQHVRRRWLRALAERCNTIIMDPKRGFLPSLQQLAAGITRGSNLMIFPEGTRSAGGELGPFKDSFAILAQELQVPVVPVVIDGAHAVLRKGRRIPRFSCPIKVAYLEPMCPRDSEDPASFSARVRERIATELARHD